MPSARITDQDREKIAEEATRWFVRMGNPLIAEEERRAFRDWVSADPAHEDAMREVEGLWLDLGPSAMRLAAEGEHYAAEPVPAAAPRRASRVFGIAAFAGIALFVFVGGALWRDAGLIDRALADYATSPGERREIALPDGSLVHLDGDTALSFAVDRGTRTLDLARGRIWLEVAEDASRPFIVAAGQVATRVLGTSFSVDRAANEVAVEHGRVEVLSGSDRVVLRDGEMTALRDEELAQPRQAAAEGVFAWRRGLIVLDAAPLATVADELERATAGRIVIVDPAVRRLRLSGVFRTDDPAAIVEAMRSGLGLRTASIPGVATFIYR